MEHASFQRRRFPGETQVLHHKQNCFPMFQEFLTADHSQWNMIKKEKNPRSVLAKLWLSARLLKYSNCKFCLRGFLSYVMRFQPVSTGLRHFVFGLFFGGKTRLGTLDDLRIGGETCPRRTSLRAVFVIRQKRFPHHGIYTYNPQLHPFMILYIKLNPFKHPWLP